MKYRLIALILLLCMVCLAGCRTDDSTVTDELPSPEESVSESVDQSKSLFTFEDGLISVELKDGRVEISFDHDLWNERYNLYDSIDPEVNTSDQLQAGPFTISGLTGEVTDVCIGMVAAFDRNDYGNFVTPSVILLMEDGTLNMTMADPYTQGEDTVFDSMRLPWLKDIASLVCEKDGAGDKTIFAADKDGLRYDLRVPYGYSALFDKELYCAQPLDEDIDNAGDYLALTLSEDGAVVYEKRWGEGDECYEIYNGTYEVRLAEAHDPGQLQAAISFDLQLDWWIWEWTEEMTAKGVAFWEKGQELSGVYSSSIGFNRDETILELEYSEGKGLIIYQDDRPPDALLVFSTKQAGASRGGSLGNGYDGGNDGGHSVGNENKRDESVKDFWYYGPSSDHDGIALAQQVLDRVPGVYEMVMEQGLYLWADGTVTNYSDGDVGKNVLLIDSIPEPYGGYNIEATYSVIENGSIYKYDSADETWYRADN